MRPDMVRGHLDLILLSELSRAAGHGYAVISALREASGGHLDLAEGSVYPALHRLEDRGLLASDWEQADGRRRRIYRITDSGLAALRAERQDWRSLVTAVDKIVKIARPVPSTGGAR